MTTIPTIPIAPTLAALLVEANPDTDVVATAHGIAVDLDDVLVIAFASEDDAP